MTRTGIRPGRAASCGPVLAALLLLAVVQANAGGIQVTPTRVDLDHDNRIAALTLTNGSDRDISFELELAHWSQADGQDRFADTDDLLASPPIFTLPAGQQQVVRIGLRSAPAPDMEGSYRLFIQELPASEEARINGLRMLLRFSLPVFVEPIDSSPQPELDWRLGAGDDGSRQLVVRNDGNAHAKVTGLVLSGDAKRGDADHALPDSMFYVLPGTTRRISLESMEPVTRAPAFTARVNGRDVEIRPDSG